MFNPFSLSNKTILITGASSGIGRETAIACSKMGATVIITGRNPERLKNTLDLCHGKNHSMLIVDLLNLSEINDLIETLPKIDGLVNNAGIVNPIIAQLSEPSDVNNIFNVNTFAPIYLIQAILQKKKLNKNASLIFMSSVAGVYCGAIGSSLYGSTKAALQGYSKSLALELAPRGIRVNTINPGMVDTGIFQNSSISKSQLEEDIKNYPLKRYGKPADIANSVIYLLSDASEWITGSSLLIDGGLTIK